MAADDGDPFEQGKLARFNQAKLERISNDELHGDSVSHENPYPENTEEHRRWEAGYKFIEQGLMSV